MNDRWIVFSSLMLLLSLLPTSEIVCFGCLLYYDSKNSLLLQLCVTHNEECGWILQVDRPGVESRRIQRKLFLQIQKQLQLCNFNYYLCYLFHNYCCIVSNHFRGKKNLSGHFSQKAIRLTQVNDIILETVQAMNHSFQTVCSLSFSLDQSLPSYQSVGKHHFLITTPHNLHNFSR